MVSFESWSNLCKQQYFLNGSVFHRRQVKFSMLSLYKVFLSDVSRYLNVFMCRMSLEIFSKLNSDRYPFDDFPCNYIQLLHHIKILTLPLCPSPHSILHGHPSLKLGRRCKPQAFQLLNTHQTSSDTALLLRLQPESQARYFSLILLGYTN